MAESWSKHELLVQRVLDSLTGPLPELTPRRVRGRTDLPGKATAVIGLRRSGKTTFLHQVRAERHASGMERERLPFLSFDDERLAGVGVEDLTRVIEEHHRLYPALKAKGRVLWCFDEVQLVAGWERLVRRLLDSGDTDVWVSGSSSALLSKEIATSLRGRAWSVLLHPFGFEEALRHAGKKVPGDPRRMSSRERASLERSFLDHLEVGGFPEAQGLDEASRTTLLRDYVDVVMLRDVIERHAVRQVEALRWLVRHLLGNAAGLFSVEKFFAALKSQGFAVAKDTVHLLLAHLEDCFLVRPVWMESASERQRMVNPRKIYPIDTGLIPIFDRTRRANLGHALETCVLLELERRRAEITYVRTPSGYEVDFLARFPDRSSVLLQVCADATDPATAERELRGLVDAVEAHPHARRLLLTATADAAPREIPAGIEVLPAYAWLLEPSEGAVGE